MEKKSAGDAIRGALCLPLQPEHKTIQTATDTEKSYAITLIDEAALFSNCGSQRQGNRTHVAEVAIGRVIFLGGYAERFEDRIAMSGTYLVADDLIDMVAGPIQFVQKRCPCARPQFHTVAKHRN